MEIVKSICDNGPTFISWEFKNLLRQNGFEHVMSAPYHPATSGLVERAVWTFRGGLKKLKKCDIHTKLVRSLLKLYLWCADEFLTD